MLSVRNLQASYGAAQVLFDVSLDVGAGEVVTLLGRNGMGKTTTDTLHHGPAAPARWRSAVRMARLSRDLRPTASRRPASASCRRAARSFRR